MVTYDSEFDYIDSATTLKAKVTAIDAVIDKLETTLLKAATSDLFEEYLLDDGQTKIKTVYRSVEAITKGLTGLEAIKQRYINRLQGRVVTMVDEKNFR